jgi:hypothetical protein
MDIWSILTGANDRDDYEDPELNDEENDAANGRFQSTTWGFISFFR